MGNLCNTSTMNYILITFKYIIPIIVIMIGFIKLVFVTNTKKAVKNFIIYTLIGMFLCLSSFLLEKQINNKCDTYNEIDLSQQEIKQDDQIEKQNDEAQTSVKEENVIETIDGVTYANGILIVNKTYSLPSAYRAPNSEGYEKCNNCLTKETLQAFNDMQADAMALNLNLYISSGFRSYEYQERIYNNYVNRDGKELADTYSARPGHSEHQTGLAFDLNTIDDSFGNTAEGKWIKDNCYRYGLILRYPKGKESITGYQYESWHLRYVGIELAEKLYNNGDWITLEEYFDLDSVYE